MFAVKWKIFMCLFWLFWLHVWRWIKSCRPAWYTSALACNLHVACVMCPSNIFFGFGLFGFDLKRACHQSLGKVWGLDILARCRNVHVLPFFFWFTFYQNTRGKVSQTRFPGVWLALLTSCDTKLNLTLLLLRSGQEGCCDLFLMGIGNLSFPMYSYKTERKVRTLPSFIPANSNGFDK